MAPSAVTIEENNYATVIRDQKDTSPHIKPVHCGQDGSSQYGQVKGKILVQEALKSRIKDIDTNICEPGEEDAFYVADLGQIYRQHQRWKKSLPRVQPHYAVKCNTDPAALRLLAAMGTGFDCASKGEIDLVLGLGVEASRIIYAQPCKTRSFIRHAAKNNVSQMTFDNTDELHKIAALYPSAELYLRIATDDTGALSPLSTKFGACMSDVPELLCLARELGLNVVGVSFHVGSGSSNPASIVSAVRDARTVFDAGTELGFTMHTLDVGGGFTSKLFEQFANALSSALVTYFPSPDVRVIAEPGRFFVADAYTLACNVIARRTVTDPLTSTQSFMLYLDDGVYGNFNGVVFEHMNPVPQVLFAQNSEVTKPIEYSVWGPTCDGIDRITPGTVMINMKIQIGDWLFFEEMGAYSLCIATKFNGFKNDHEIIYVCSEPAAEALIKK